MAIKIVVSEPKSGKSKQMELSDEQSESLYNMKIGQKLEGNLVGLEGYELEIRGGSNDSGFPMRKDVEGNDRKKILAISGVGLKSRGKGIRTRKSVAGNTIGEKTAQVNLKVIKLGKENIFEEKKEETKAEETKTE